MTETTLANKTSILAGFYIDYKGIGGFEDFFQYNDLGLPLAYAIDSGIVAPTSKTEPLICETFDLLLESAGWGQDEGFEDLSDILRTE